MDCTMYGKEETNAYAFFVHSQKSKLCVRCFLTHSCAAFKTALLNGCGVCPSVVFDSGHLTA